MAKVFLSYDHDDAALARPIAAALEKAGHTVWYDRYIHGGAQYSHRIEQELDAANAVVVLWSPQSIDSAWVRDEAAEGRDREKLVPLSIAGAIPPIGFRQFQTIDLGNWSGHGRVPNLARLIESIENQARDPADGSERAPSATHSAPSAPSGRRRVLSAIGPVTAVLVLAAAVGGWAWRTHSELPVVQVAAASSSAQSKAAADDLFVKLGSWAHLANGKWQLVNADSTTGTPDLVFRTTDAGSPSDPRASVVLLDGKNDTLLWSREFALPAGRDADLRQQLALTAGRVLGCALESRDQGALSADLFKTFLDACASLADLSGDDYGPVTAQLRRIVDSADRFKPAWSRLIAAESTAISYSSVEGRSAPLKRQLKADVQRVRAIFPDLPELAVAELRLSDHVDYGRAIERLSAAAERDPENPHLQAELSDALLDVGRMGDAIAKARRAAELDPLSPGGTTTYIMTLAHGGKLESARTELAKAEKLWAGTGSLRDAQIAFFVRYGDPAVAMKLNPEGYNTAAFYRARANPSPANISKLKAGIDEFRPKTVTPEQVGWAVQALGEFGLVDDAFYWFGRLPSRDLANMSYLFFRPALASVRRDPRFMQLAKRTGLVDYWITSGQWPDFCQRPGIAYDCKVEAAKLK